MTLEQTLLGKIRKNFQRDHQSPIVRSRSEQLVDSVDVAKIVEAIINGCPNLAAMHNTPHTHQTLFWCLMIIGNWIVLINDRQISPSKLWRKSIELIEIKIQAIVFHLLIVVFICCPLVNYFVDRPLAIHSYTMPETRAPGPFSNRMYNFINHFCFCSCLVVVAFIFFLIAGWRKQNKFRRRHHRCGIP